MDTAIPKPRTKKNKLWLAVVRTWEILTCKHEWVNADEHGQEQNCKKCPAFRSVHGI